MKLRILVLSFCCCLAGLWAAPSALVNHPADLRLIDLKDNARFLEEDLDLGKGITEVIGKQVIDRRFRSAGIPDPVKKSLSYGIVAREMPVDELNVCFVLKGDLDTEKFLAFADKRYQRYFETLKAQKLTHQTPTPRFVRIANRSARVYPFAFRKAEAVVTTFPGHVIVSTVPTGEYSLIEETVKVLDGKIPASSEQPDKIGFMTTFVPLAQERTEIRNFENRYEGFAAKTRKQFKKVTAPDKFRNEQAMNKAEQQLKVAMSDVSKFSYEIGARREGDGYAYDVNMIFRCGSKAKAQAMKEMLLTWLAYTSSKALSEEDLVSMKANLVTSTDEACIYTIKMGSSPDEQYQFSSLLLSLMMQDRRFKSIF